MAVWNIYRTRNTKYPSIQSSCNIKSLEFKLTELFSLSLSLSLLCLFFSFSHVGTWVKYSFLWANTLKFQKKPVNSQCGLFLPLWLSSCSITCSIISNTMFDLSLLLTSSCVTLCFRIILCWVLVLKSGLAKLGAALSVSLSYWPHALLLG